MLTIHTAPTFQPEKTYCFHVLLHELLGLEYRVAFSDAEKNYRLQVPNGGQVVVEDHFFGKMRDGEHYASAENLPASPHNFPCPYAPGEQIAALYGTPHFWSKKPEPVICCGLDLFASAFFMLSRWEEQALLDRDRHGRFPAESSAAWRGQFLQRPVVNEWAALLRHLFAQVGWHPPATARTARLSLTCDVDHPRLWWSAADRLRTLGGSFFSRKNPREALFWVKNHLLRRQDPYDTFDEIMAAAERSGQPAHFHFLGKRPAHSDCWYPLEHPIVLRLLRRIAERGHIIGFHPSYEAFDDPAIFRKELESLRRVSLQPVLSGRHHYLRFAAPQTWRLWDDAGMAWDSTLGYPEHPGFRCGICCDFPVFDFERRKTLNLREKPLVAMDVTLAQYRRWSPARALDELAQLRRESDKHGGEFVLLWHNSSLNGWAWRGWREVFSVWAGGSDELW
jgi:hypothetical protein